MSRKDAGDLLDQIEGRSVADYLKCAACGRDAECAVWEVDVCYRCCADWSKTAPTYGEIGKQDAATMYRQFTAKWLAEKKARVAA